MVLVFARAFFKVILVNVQPTCKRSFYDGYVGSHIIEEAGKRAEEPNPASKTSKIRGRSVAGSSPSAEFEASSLYPAELYHIASQLRRQQEVLYDSMHQTAQRKKQEERAAAEPKPVAAVPVKKARRRGMFGSPPKRPPERTAPTVGGCLSYGARKEIFETTLWYLGILCSLGRLFFSCLRVGLSKASASKQKGRR